MSNNRYFPFGYHMQNGEVIAHTDESEIVKQIFIKTIDGESLNTIADYCNTQSVPYNTDKPEWTKHMVRRVLENKKYYENTQYPPLIEKAVFDKAYSLRTQKVEKQADDIKALRQYIFCGLCESKMSFLKQKQQKYKCSCKNCGHESKTLTISELQEEIHDMLLKIFTDNSLIEAPVKTTTEFPTELIKADQELNYMFEQTTIDADDALAAIIKRTEEQYKVCKVRDLDPPTLFLKDFVKNEHTQSFDEDVFIKTVKKVLIGRQSISIKLINNQVI